MNTLWIDFSKFELPDYTELDLNELNSLGRWGTMIILDNSHVVQAHRLQGVCKKNKVTATIRQVQLLPEQYRTGMKFKITNIPKAKTVRRMYTKHNYDTVKLLDSLLKHNLRTIDDPFLYEYVND